MNRSLDVAIIGAGFAGLGAAIRLRQAGIKDVRILERANDVGGTWRDNTYPGAACDIPSNLYSYSFAPNPEWSRSFAGGPEILAYVERMVSDHALRPLIDFGTSVKGLVFDEAEGRWIIETASGATYRARAVVNASGPLSNASLPKMPGLASYEGHKVHSARWDHTYDFRDKRVAVVGTGASAVQIIPELVKTAAAVKVFQRTPGWVLPRPDFAVPESEKNLFRRSPKAQAAVRRAIYLGHESMALGLIWNTPLTATVEAVGRAHLRRQVRDPWMRRQLAPEYRIGCKRVLMSNDYYPALQRPNAKLITWPIATLAPKGIRTADGIEHRVDCIVFATGFDVAKSGTPFPIVGRRGRSLGDEWARGARAFKSVCVSGYPNLFFTFGPNSGPGHNSALVYMESQIDYLVKGIGTILREDLRSLDVKPEVEARYNTELQRRLAKTNWNSGCKSWYLTEDGFNATMYPGFATQFANELRDFERESYEGLRAERSRPNAVAPAGVATG